MLYVAVDVKLRRAHYYDCAVVFTSSLQVDLRIGLDMRWQDRAMHYAMRYASRRKNRFSFHILGSVINDNQPLVQANPPVHL